MEQIDTAHSTPSPEELVSQGLDYSTGNGVPQDLVEAHACLNLAAIMGSDEAKRLRAEIARDMAPDEIAEAQRRARERRARLLH